MKFYSSSQFASFRILFGIYLLIHFAMLLPYGPELWSNEGVLPRASLNFTYPAFFNLLNLFDSPLGVQVFISGLIFLAILFATGYKRQLIALLLWYGWACLFNRNNLISNPGIPFVGWLLLVCAVVPAGEPAWISEKKKDWEMPAIIYYGAWVIMSIGYCISGIDKLGSPSWIDGTAMYHLLNNPLARDSFFRDFLLLMPMWVFKMMTWISLGLELVFLPFAIFQRTRSWAWFGMVGMHLGILLIVDFADLTFGMLMIHFFTFQRGWLERKSRAR
jgi:hypothetical protein